MGGIRVEQYIHDEAKRLNNPPVGLVTAETDHLRGKKTYKFDPHLDPELQWAGKTEWSSFEVDTVSLHVHERVDPKTIIRSMEKGSAREQQSLVGYFESDENNPPIREAIEFYRHEQGWSNRLIAGDSLLVMNSLLDKEGFAGKVQVVYFDPPYGIRYGSNFQPFVSKKDVRDGKDDDLTREPEMIKAFRDTWELGIHSYLTYLRGRLALCKELLADSGSIFVQISDSNLGHVREIMDEVFGAANRLGVIVIQKTTSSTSTKLPTVNDFLLWYAKDSNQTTYHQLFKTKTFEEEGRSYNKVVESNGEVRGITEKERRDGLPPGLSLATLSDLTSDSPGSRYPVEFKGKTFWPGAGRYWSTDPKGMERLIASGRVAIAGETLRYVRYWDDFAGVPITNVWTDVAYSTFGETKLYVVQTSSKVVERCILMASNPGDLVFDPTCGSGTAAFAAEKWGRRWMTCDTSRVALTIARQRLMTSTFPYFKLKRRDQGLRYGFELRTIPHTSFGSTVQGRPPDTEELHDKPVVDESIVRVSGPFTVEAVPSLQVRSFDDVGKPAEEADMSLGRSGETSRINDWADELLSAGIRGKDGQTIEFARVELLGGTRWIHAVAESKKGDRCAVSFGPEYAPLEQRQVELAIDEAQQLVPKPRTIIFSAFQFDPEASKDIDELKWPGVDVLKVHMNADLFTADLKKHKPSNESFWLVGQPDIELRGLDGKYQVVVNGFDYYDTKTDKIKSGDITEIAMWEVDTDYDGRSLYPRQVFFPMAGKKEGWRKLAKTLKSVVEEDLVEAYGGNKSIPFHVGENKQVAVKVLDDRGIESLKVIRVKD